MSNNPDKLKSSFMGKIIRTVREELERSATQQQLQCVINPLIVYTLRCFQPYIIILLVLLIISISLQAYCVYSSIQLCQMLNARA